MTTPTRQITDPAQDSPGQPCKILLSVKATTNSVAECRRILEALELPGGAKLSVTWWGRL